MYCACFLTDIHIYANTYYVNDIYVYDTCIKVLTYLSTVAWATLECNYANEGFLKTTRYRKYVDHAAIR